MRLLAVHATFDYGYDMCVMIGMSSTRACVVILDTSASCIKCEGQAVCVCVCVRARARVYSYTAKVCTHIHRHSRARPGASNFPCVCVLTNAIMNERSPASVWRASDVCAPSCACSNTLSLCQRCAVARQHESNAAACPVARSMQCEECRPWCGSTQGIQQLAW